MLSVQVLIYIFLAIILATVSRLLTRKVMQHHDPFAYSLLINGVAAIFFLPIALSKLPYALEPYVWIIAIATGVFWALASFTSTTAYKYTEVSLKEPISKIRMVFTLILGILVLKESLSVSKVIGTAAIFLGTAVMVYHPERKWANINSKGIRWTLIAALMASLVIILDKFALNFFPVELYGFLAFFLPWCVLMLFIPKRHHHFTTLMKLHPISSLAAAFFTAASYYMGLKAVSLAEVTLVHPLLEAGLLLTVAGGILFMKERDCIPQKIIGTLLTLAGAMMIGSG